MSPSPDRFDHGRFAFLKRVGAIAALPLQFLLRLPSISVQLSQFFLSEVVTRPTVLLAILLHGGLLALPALKLTEPEADQLNAPEEEEEPIEVQSLADLIAAAPESEPPPPEVEAPPPEVEAPPPVQEQQVITEVPEDLPQEELPPIEEIPPEQPFDEPPLEPEPPVTLFDAGASQTVALSFAGDAGYNDNALPTSFKSADRQYFYTPDDQTRMGAPKYTARAPRFPTILSIYSRESTDVATAFAEANQLAQGSGLSLFDAGTYGPFQLYGAQDAEGNVPLYITLVEGQIVANSLIVFWSSDPNG